MLARLHSRRKTVATSSRKSAEKSFPEHIPGLSIKVRVCGLPVMRSFGLANGRSFIDDTQPIILSLRKSLRRFSWDNRRQKIFKV